MKSVISRLVVCLILVAFILQGFSSAAIATPKMPVASLQEQPPDDSYEYPDVPPPYLEVDNLQLGLTEPEQREFEPASPELIAQTHAEVMAFDCETVEDVTTEECEVLLDLYDATTGAGWVNNDGWLSGNYVEDWHGITISSGIFVEIDLRRNNLVGTLPVSLGDLSKLSYLNLGVNQLVGPIPAELGNLNNLYYLDLTNNQLSGSIPAALGKLDHLADLNFYNNRLSGLIPQELGDLKNLQNLALHYNQFSGLIPPEIGNLKNLSHLQLGNNQLSGSIPEELGDLKKLVVLFLDNNQLSGSIPASLGALEKLVNLNLSNNQLSGPIPEELGNLKELLSLSLEYNQLSGSIPPELGGLENVNGISFKANYLSGSFPKELKKLKELKTLNLAMNQLEGEVPEEIGELTSLVKLDLQSNAFSGKLPESIKNLPLSNSFYVGYNRLDEDQSADILAFLETNNPSWLSTQAVSFSINGETGGYVNSRNNYVRLEIPAGAFVGEDLITFAPHLQHWEANAHFVPTTLNFKLYPSNPSSPANNLSSDLIININYGSISLGELPEEDLHLHYYDYDANPGRWVPVEKICKNTIYERDPNQDKIRLNLCRLGEFALGGPHISDHYSIFLPLVVR